MTSTPVSPHNGDRERAPQATIRAGSQLQGRYNLINRIAKGGMGEVWRARDTRTGTMVAAKVLRPELTGEEISLSRLRIEAKNAMKARHPNIAAVLDSGESDGQGWIVMELVPGNPLTDYVGDGKRLSAQELIPILSQTAFALDGAAQAGIVHRDIKPANIIVREDGMVKLTDFGISYTAGQANLTAVGMVMGTAQYLAPEQAMGSVATHSGDLYALGVIAYEALAGYRPFTGKTVVEIAMAHVNEDVPPLPADVPPPLAEVVYQLLEKDPKKRPPSGTALVRALSKVAAEIDVTTDPRPLREPKVVQAPKPRVEGATPPKVDPRTATRRARMSRTDNTTPRKPSVSALRPAPTASPTPQEAPKAASARTRARTQAPPQTRSPQPTPSTPQRDSLWHPVSAAPAKGAQRNPPAPRSRVADKAGQKKNDVGLWIIIGLVVLTVVLIIVAMLRDKTPDGNAQASGPGWSSYSAELEVELWLSTIHVS